MYSDYFEDFKGQSSKSNLGLRIYILNKPQSNMQFRGKLFPLKYRQDCHLSKMPKSMV
jgi:hypothetical protein